MKKFFAILLTICMTVGALCITAVPVFAADAPAAGVVLRVSAIKTNGDNKVIKDYTSFEEGWNDAIAFALPKNLKANNYDRIVVDFYADWKANDAGEFGDDSGRGFDNNTIEIPDDVKITVNLNEHTINRALAECIADGEVIYIDEDADVIINNGTITGGWSNNGAGGLHVHDADLTLNNVNVMKNRISNDDGGGIVLEDNANLTMNGGCISDNSASSNYVTTSYGVGLFADDSKAVLNKVTISNNQSTGSYECKGAAIYAENSEVTLDECVVKDNGVANKAKDIVGAYSVVHVDRNSLFTANNTTFSGNGTHEEIFKFQINAGEGGGGTHTPDAMIDLDRGTCSLNNCTITQNRSMILIDCTDGAVSVTDTTFTNNQSSVWDGSCKIPSSFTRCTFKGNTPDKYTFDFAGDSNLTFVDCQMNESTYDNKNHARFEAATSSAAASIFGEGSVAMIVSLLALVASVASICLTVAYNKKKEKAAPVAVNNAEDKEA